MSYCQYAATLPETDLHFQYHRFQYGFPIEDDNELFGRLILEINQAGLSWTTILKKQHHFREAYAGYSIEKVASFGEEEIQQLLQNPGIIRNRLKILAAIHNAHVIRSLQSEFGSFRQWIEHHHPKTREEWTRIFKKTFRFTGGEIVNEFLMSTGYLPGAHTPDCPVYEVYRNSGAAVFRP